MTKRMLPASSAAGPYPDIQMADRKKLRKDVGCVSKSWLAGSADSDPASQPNNQPRDKLAAKSQKLPKPAYMLPSSNSKAGRCRWYVALNLNVVPSVRVWDAVTTCGVTCLIGFPGLAHECGRLALKDP